jgi:purine-nucleoside phosphorylase
MAEKSYGQLLTEGIVRAIPWAIVFSLAFLITMKIFMGMLGQEVKKAIDLTAKTAINTSMNAVLSSEVFPRIKQNTKEAIEYTVHTVNRELVAQYVKPISVKK